MSEWPQVALKDCARVIGGATPKSSVNEFWDGDVLWTTPKDLSNIEGKYLDDTPRKITAAGLRSCAAELLPPNSVLFSSRAPIGHVAINSVPMATNQGFKSLVPGPELDSSYLYWWLKCHRAELEQLGNGATFKEVSKSVVERVEIPLPPLAEQKRVATILDQADELRRKRRRVGDRINQLGQAIYNEMFGQLLSRESGAGFLHLSNLVSVKSGYAFKSDDFAEEGHAIVRISNLDGINVSLRDAARIPTSRLGKGARYELQGGDLLIAMSGATTGKIGLVPKLAERAFLNQRVGKYEILDQKLIKPMFLRYLVTSPAYQKFALSGAWGAAQPNVSGKQLVDMWIALPSAEEQDVFSDRVGQAQALSVHALAASSSTNDLFDTLQHRAFKGEL